MKKMTEKQMRKVEGGWKCPHCKKNVCWIFKWWHQATCSADKANWASRW